MNDAQHATRQWLQNETHRFASDCFAAMARVRAATTMQAVRRAADVQVPPVLHAMRHAASDFRRLKQQAERRMEELGAAHLNALRDTRSAADCKALRGQYQTQDWQYLRGHYPRVLQRLIQESLQVLHQKEQAAK